MDSNIAQRGVGHILAKVTNCGLTYLRNGADLRPHDTNIVAALSDTERDMSFVQYGIGATDRLGSPADGDLRSVIGEVPQQMQTVRTTTLNHILAKHGAAIERIGYLNVDCEGHDFQVIRGLDLDRYRPAIITIEADTPADKSAVVAHLDGAGYEHKETLHRTLLFVRQE